MMSSMHRKALTITLLLSSAAIGAMTAPQAVIRLAPAALQASAGDIPTTTPQAVQPSYQPSPVVAAPRVSNALAQWNTLRQTDNLPFSSYASFLRSYRGWPGENALRRTAERAIDPNATSPSEVVAYFSALPPLTGLGHARHAAALLALGRVEEARAAARSAWYAGVLPPADEARILGLFGAAFSSTDHDRRMETLLANADTVSALRTLPYVSPARRTVYDARIALQTNAADAASRLQLIGTAADTDPGVIRDRANWLRNNGQSAAARNLLAQPRTLSALPADPEKWYETLLTMARAAANDRNWDTAYRIASQVDDAYAPGTDVSTRSLGERDDYTSLTWLAGTVALQRLNRPADAQRMFEKYGRAAQSPQSITKGLYWAGRAAQAAGQAAQANAYYQEAGTHFDQFYGQLALERLGQPLPPPAPPSLAQPTTEQRQAFYARELVQAVRLLGQMGAWRDQSEFLRAIAADVKTDADRLLAVELSREIARPDLGVMVARRARADGSTDYKRWGFPETRVPGGHEANWTMIHAIARQESQFDREAVSHAGARGLMQLMPGTARETAGKLGLPYEMNRLTRDTDYNIMLGSTYFSRMMDYWSGNYPLAVASYNAGPGNVRKWIAANGDPRMPGVDMIDWIEAIPIFETRNYVQRVLENAVVYDLMNPNRARTPDKNRLSHYLGKENQPG